MFGLSKYGFRRKTYDDILTELIRDSRDAFGEDVNTSSKSILGMFLRIIAWVVSKLWKLAESVYLNGYLKYAEGVQLDRLAGNIGITRLGSRVAEGYINVYKNIEEEPAHIPIGFIVEASNGQRYRTVEEKEIKVQGDKVKVESLGKGEDTNLIAGNEFNIITPSVNVGRVVNNEEITGGRNEETDVEFRERCYKAMEGTGSSTRASIEATIRQLPKVDDARVIENDTNEPQGKVPPHSIYAIVLGGEDEAVAKAILETKSAGIGTVGEVEVEIEDEGGMKYKVYYDRGKEKEVKITLRLVINKDYSSKYEDQIEKDIEEHIQSLGLGDTLYVSRVIMSLQTIPGLENIKVEINGKAEDFIPESNEAVTLGELVFDYADRL